MSVTHSISHAATVSGAASVAARSWRRHVWWLPAAVVTAAHLPLLSVYVVRLLQTPQYRFVPLSFVAAAVLAVRDFRARDRHSVVVARWPIVPTLVAWSLLAVAIAWRSPRLAALAGLAALWAGGERWGGAAGRRAMFSAWLVVALSWEPPWGLATRLFQTVHRNAISWAEQIFDALGMLHAVVDQRLLVPGLRLLDDDARYGAPWLVAATVGAFWLACWRQRRPWMGAVLVVSAGALAVIVDLLRLVLIGQFGLMSRVALDRGVGGWCLDLALAGLISWLVLGVDAALNWRRRRRKLPEKPVAESPDEAPYPVRSQRLTGLVLGPDGTVERVVVVPRQVRESTWPAQAWRIWQASGWPQSVVVAYLGLLVWQACGAVPFWESWLSGRPGP